MRAWTRQTTLGSLISLYLALDAQAQEPPKVQPFVGMDETTKIVAQSSTSGANPAIKETNMTTAKHGSEHITGIRPFQETTFRVKGQGDNWHMTWADDDKQYVGLCDGGGLPGTSGGNSRVITASGNPPKVTFGDTPTYPGGGCTQVDDGRTRYYNFGILAIDDRIYSFLSTHAHPWKAPTRFIGAKLIYATGHGKAWYNQDGSTPVRWEQKSERSQKNMIFFEEPGDAFSLLTVLQMGQNYRDNTDGYVYVYSLNGIVEGTMNQLVMCRVAKDKILDRDSYEFFKSLRPNGSAEWSRRIEDRGVVHTFPSGWVNQLAHPYAWHPSVVYIASLKQYLMVNWGMGCTPDGKEWFGKPSYLGFWTSPQPWGPWTQVYEDKAWTPVGIGSRCYQPQISPKWIAEDGKSLWLVWTDFQNVPGKGQIYYTFNAQKMEVVTTP